MQLQQQAACCLPLSCYTPGNAQLCCLLLANLTPLLKVSAPMDSSCRAGSEPCWTSAVHLPGALLAAQDCKRPPCLCCLQCCKWPWADGNHLPQHLILHFHDHLVSLQSRFACPCAQLRTTTVPLLAICSARVLTCLRCLPCLAAGAFCCCCVTAM